MTYPHRRPLVALVALLALAAVSGACSGETRRDEARCRELAGPPGFAIYNGVRVLEGSEVRGRRVLAGQPAACVGRAAGTLLAIARARAHLPVALRRPVDVHLDPTGDHRPDGAEALIDHRALLVDGRTGPGLDESIWVHELIHVAASGGRPADPVGARLVAAVDEAAADYGAASILGRPRVGPATGAGARDLSATEALPPGAFHALAVGRGFDAHGFGLPLAADLWRREPRAGALMEDLVLALAGGDGAPWPEGAGARAAAAALISRCPSRSRPLLGEVMAEWLPEELRP